MSDPTTQQFRVARLRYQACSADECFPPNEVVLRLPLESLDNVRDR